VESNIKMSMLKGKETKYKIYVYFKQ